MTLQSKDNDGLDRRVNRTSDFHVQNFCQLSVFTSKYIFSIISLSSWLQQQHFKIKPNEPGFMLASASENLHVRMNHTFSVEGEAMKQN